MGTRDLSERELIQGLIKLAAAFVHQARGNPPGIEKNLRGARTRIESGAAAGETLGVDAAALLRSIDAWLAAPGGPAVRVSRPASASSDIFPAAGN